MRRVKTTIVDAGEEAGWARGVTFLAGFWLVLSAFMFVPLDVREAGAWNSLAVGVVLALTAALGPRVGLGLAGFLGLNAALGAWIIASPFLFDYATNAAQTWTSLIVGFVVVIAAPAMGSARGVVRAEPRPGHGGADYSGMGPRAWRSSDEQIQDTICERMAEHPDLDATGVEVAVRDGEVTLQGSVPSRGAKRLAEDLADAVGGVIDVHNVLRIEPREAAEISRAA